MEAAEQIPEPEVGAHERWLNRQVVGLGLASFFNDIGHEMASALLPVFLLVALHTPVLFLGVIEGVADGLASFVQLFSSWLSARTGRHKALALLGYALTSVSKPLYALAGAWPALLLFRSTGWIGRGLRVPPREALLAEAVTPASYDHVFTFQQWMETLGAVIGPGIAVALLLALTSGNGDLTSAFHTIFLLTAIPGLLCLLTVVFVVRGHGGEHAEHKEPPEATPEWRGWRALPAAFRLFTLSVGLFGMANFAPAFLIWWTRQQLAPEFGQRAAIATALVLVMGQNMIFAFGSFPAGRLGQSIGKKWALCAGYGVFALLSLVCAGFPDNVHGVLLVSILVVVFIWSGLSMALIGAAQGTLAADLLPEEHRESGFAVLGAVGGVGGLVSSLIMGVIYYRYGPPYAFSYAVILSVAGLIALLVVRAETPAGPENALAREEFSSERMDLG